MKVQVLVTTMHQSDLSKYREMNLQTDTIIANQADCNGFMYEKIENNHVSMITTKTRGTSRNRNIALVHSTADIIIFADDDLVFKDGYEQIVTEEFDKHPETDAIKFNLNCVSERKISMKPITAFYKPNRRQVTSWGVCGLAVKREILVKNCLFFDENFGPGTENFCGEDTIFLQELLKRKIKLYASPIYIADIDQTTSSWFKGYSEKQFKVSGKILSRIYPLLSYAIAIRSAYKYKRRGAEYSFVEILKSYFEGIREYKKQWR